MSAVSLRFEVTSTRRFEATVDSATLPPKVAEAIADLDAMPEGRRMMDDLTDNQRIAILEFLLDGMAPDLEPVDDSVGDVIVNTLGTYTGGGVL